MVVTVSQQLFAFQPYSVSVFWIDTSRYCFVGIISVFIPALFLFNLLKLRVTPVSVGIL